MACKPTSTLRGASDLDHLVSLVEIALEVFNLATQPGHLAVAGIGLGAACRLANAAIAPRSRWRRHCEINNE